MRKRFYTIALEIKEALSREIPVIQVRVFGSCARGDEREDSDIDVFIEVEQCTRQVKGRIRDLTWRIGLENGAVISPLIFSREEMEQSPARSSDIVRNILEEGVSV